VLALLSASAAASKRWIGLTMNARHSAAPTPVAAQASQIFHGLFQDTGRAAPVAAVVSQLWTTPNALPDGAAAPAGEPGHRDLRNLFSDPGDKT